MTEQLEKKSTKVIKKDVLKIMPFINPDSENMGLTGYGMVLHDGANWKEPLTYLELNKGVRRYLTGLNEFAPEVQSLRDDAEKKAVIKSIRQKVSFLEKTLGAKDVPIDHEKFWDEIKLIHPNNYEFWDGIFIQPGNEPVFLDPADPNDLIKICGIDAGGFGIVAKSYEDAKMSSNPPKFYLDKSVDVAVSKNEIKRIKNEAGALLNELYTKDPVKLRYVIKNIDPQSQQYKKSTSIEIIYNYLDEHVSGKGFERSAKKAAQEFLSVAKLPVDELRIKAVIADANVYKIIQGRSDGMIYHNATGSMLGRNASDVLAYFKQELNSKIWDEVRVEVEKYWNDEK